MNENGPLPGQEIKPPLADHETQGSVHLDAMRGAAALLVFLNHTRALYFNSAMDAYDKPAEGTHSKPQTDLRADLLTRSRGGGESSTGITQLLQRDPGGVAGWQELFHGEIKIASEAVIIFFVLSGYLVGGSVVRSLNKHRWSWKVYFTKRLTRLYMVLLPALALTVGLDHLGIRLAGPGSVYSTPKGIGIVATYHLLDNLRPIVILGNALFVQGILVPDVGSNVSIWSLCSEFWYYLMFPLLALACTVNRLHLRLLYLSTVVAIVWFIGPGIALQFPVWLAGALLALLPRKLAEQQARTGSLVALVSLLTSMAAVRLLHLRPIIADYILGIAACVLLFFAVQQCEPAKPGVYRNVSGFFSRISYSLYLFHLPLAVLLCGRFNDPWRPWSRTPTHVAEFIGIDTGIVAVVWCLWRVFEANTDKVRHWMFEREA